MRTTLTLDDDVAAKVAATMRQSQTTLRETINSLLRTALNEPKPAAPLRRFRVKARDLGLLPGLSYDDVGELLERLEGPAHR